jgi:membrane associated rhomboid family serine protease
MQPALDIDFRRTPVTIILAGITLALEIVCTLDPERRFYYYNDLKLGMLSTIWEGELWRPFTTTLLHANLLHAAFNTAWLWVFGQTLEPRFGSLRFLGLCVLLAYGSMLPQFLVTNYHVPVDAQVGCVGFSGVVYGLFGLLWVGRRWRPELAEVCDAQTVKLMLGWFVLCIALTHLDLMPVANIAHGAGLAFGVLYGLAAFDVRRRLRWSALAVAATLAVLATLLGFPGHNGYEAAKYNRDVQRLWHEIRNAQQSRQRPDADQQP